MLEEALSYCGAGTRSAAGVGRIGTYERDAATGLSTWSQGLKEIVGTCAKDPIDPEQELLPRLHPEDRAAFQASVARAFATPDAGEHDLEYRILRDDGEVRWLRDTGCVIFDVSDDGERRPLRAIGSVIDLTPQRLAEAVTRDHQRQIQQALTRSEAISRQMTEGLVIFDASGNLVDMNPAALAMHGFESVDALRRHLHDLGGIFDLSALDGRPLDTHQWPIARALRGEHFIDFEVRVRNRHTLSQQTPVAKAAPIGEPSERVAELRILVVDDNKDIADALEMLLQTLGAKTAVVYTGADALAAIPQFGPDLMLADIGMPVMDGYELARQVRAQYPPGQLTLVAVTGWCADEDRRRVQEAGFDHHLVKPVGIATLKDVLASKLSRATDDVARG